MFEVSNYLKAAIAQELMGGVDLTKATQFTMKLFSDVVDLDGVGTELTTPEYEQFVFANDTTNFPPLTDGTAVNNFTMQSTDPFSADATYQSIGLFDHLGNLWFRKVVTRTIYQSDYQLVEPGDIVLSVG